MSTQIEARFTTALGLQPPWHVAKVELNTGKPLKCAVAAIIKFYLASANESHPIAEVAVASPGVTPLISVGNLPRIGSSS